VSEVKPSKMSQKVAESNTEASGMQLILQMLQEGAERDKQNQQTKQKYWKH
jgi:hypothetical protein